jgi:hypothetical protein
VTVKAIAEAPGLANSSILTAIYSLVMPTTPTPVISPPTDTYAPLQVTAKGFAPAPVVVITDAQTAATIYYTTDGSQPTRSSKVYTSSFAPDAGVITTVKAMAVLNGFNDSAVTPPTTYTVPTLPSSLVSEPFLYNNYPGNTCDYYQKIGAIVDCTQATDQFGAYYSNTAPDTATFQAWLSAHHFPSQTQLNTSNFPPSSVTPCPTNSDARDFSCSASALFINAMDLNFARAHGATMSGGASAAYVCNYPGSDFYHSDPQNTASAAQINAALQNAQQKARQGVVDLACVAFDYGPNVNAATQVSLNLGEFFMRYLVFNQAGHLVDGIDLDGFGKKAVPNACSACHGIPYGAGSGDGTQILNLGRYIPFDENNFLFSAQSGLTRAQQETSIKNLNLIVLNTAIRQGLQGVGDSAPISDLIHGFYDTLTTTYDLQTQCPVSIQVTGPLAATTQQLYVPTPMLLNCGLPAATELGVYVDAYAPLCRSCHVANGVKYLSANVEPTHPGDMFQLFERVNLCGLASPIMPNSRVGFDRLWTDLLPPSRDQLNLLTTIDQYYSDNHSICKLYPFPNLVR